MLQWRRWRNCLSHFYVHLHERFLLHPRIESHQRSKTEGGMDSSWGTFSRGNGHVRRSVESLETLVEERLLTESWRAVAMAEHIGRVNSSGHIIAWTKRSDGKWQVHDDDKEPKLTAANGFVHPRSPRNGEAFMGGISLIVFERIC